MRTPLTYFRALAALALLSTAALAACPIELADSNAMTVELAVELVKADASFLDAGKDIIDLAEIGDEAEQKLVTAGFLELVGHKQFALTALGREAAKGWEVLATSEDGTPRQWRVRVTHRAFLEVTRSRVSSRAVSLGFSWRWEPTGAVGAVLAEPGPRRLSSVEFRRDDEGWRMAPIDF